MKGAGFSSRVLFSPMQIPMQTRTNAPEIQADETAPGVAQSQRTWLSNRSGWRSGLGAVLAVLATAGAVFLGMPLPFALALGLLACIAAGWDASRRDRLRNSVLEELVERVRNLDRRSIECVDSGPWSDLIGQWNDEWSALCDAIDRTRRLCTRVHQLPSRVDEVFVEVVASADRQEEAVEETASLVAHMRQSMSAIESEVRQLLVSSDESASAILQLGSSIDEVANNTAALHQIVDSSTSSVHEMGVSIRQVADGAEQVRELAETTAVSVTQMDRSVQEVSTNAVEAASLTERAHQGATAGREAVRATISDIEQISSLTTQAMDRLAGLVSRISQIGSILSAIDEINDETNLLSLNAAIIAAQAGEQGKAFLVVANHVKTLARRTSASTHDIEKLIRDIELESSEAVRAMEAGIAAVAKGVNRSRDAGTALESIQESCSEASARVSEIARATTEQSRNSKGVAEATQRTSSEIHQISNALTEQRRASESMLASAENALASCLLVHRSTDEQRETSRHITAAISEISDMIRQIGIQTSVHGSASESVSAAVMSLLDNAQSSAKGIGPLREWVTDLDRLASDLALPAAVAETAGDLEA